MDYNPYTTKDVINHTYSHFTTGLASPFTERGPGQKSTYIITLISLLSDTDLESAYSLTDGCNL